MIDASWKPIDTANINKRLIVFSPVHGVIEAAWECVDGGGHPENGPAINWWVSEHVEFCDGPYDAPTHWLIELPDDPSNRSK